MAFTLPNGTAVFVARTYGTAVNITAITNAVEAVATLGAGHGVVVGDYLEITSGWGRLNSRVVRAKTVVTNDVTLELVNTTSTSRFPAGAGVGTLRRITAWDEVLQIKADGIATSGGEQQFADITTLQDVTARNIPVIRSAQGLTITVFDDPLLAFVPTITGYQEAQASAGIRLNYPSGAKSVGNAFLSIGTFPGITGGQAMENTITVSFVADPVRYPT
jgi:hypothetical protein